MTGFKHNPKTGVWSVSLREGKTESIVRLGPSGSGAFIEVDRDGNVLNVEFPSFEEFAAMLARTDGKLEIPPRIPHALWQSEQ